MDWSSRKRKLLDIRCAGLLSSTFRTDQSLQCHRVLDKPRHYNLLLHSILPGHPPYIYMQSIWQSIFSTWRSQVHDLCFQNDVSLATELKNAVSDFSYHVLIKPDAKKCLGIISWDNDRLQTWAVARVDDKLYWVVEGRCALGWRGNKRQSSSRLSPPRSLSLM